MKNIVIILMLLLSGCNEPQNSRIFVGNGTMNSPDSMYTISLMSYYSHPHVKQRKHKK